MLTGRVLFSLTDVQADVLHRIARGERVELGRTVDALMRRGLVEADPFARHRLTVAGNAAASLLRSLGKPEG